MQQVIHLAGSDTGPRYSPPNPGPGALRQAARIAAKVAQHPPIQDAEPSRQRRRWLAAKRRRA